MIEDQRQMSWCRWSEEVKVYIKVYVPRNSEEAPTDDSVYTRNVVYVEVLQVPTLDMCRPITILVCLFKKVLKCFFFQ